MQTASRKIWIGAGAVIALYLASALLLSYTKRPYMDEAWVANPGIDLITRGSTGVTVMEPSGNGVFVGVTLTGIENHTYLWAPFAAILMLYLYFDRHRFLWWHPALAALPLMIGAAGWGWYILQYPADFRAQTAAAFTGRLGTKSPWSGIVREFTERYLGYYLPSYATGFRKAKVLIVAVYFAAVAACLGVPAIRRNSAWRVLLRFAPLYM